MKDFKIISTSFIIFIMIIFGFNVFYLVSLYRSIKTNIERDVITALANADIDDMWERAERAAKESKAAMETAIAAGMDVNVQKTGTINGVKDDKGNFVTTSVTADGDTVVNSMPLRQDNSFANQMVDDMSRQMHAGLDAFIDFNLEVMDSIFTNRLADRGIYPEFAAVEIIDSNGKIKVKNNRIFKDKSNYDNFTLCFNPAEGSYYRACITPLTNHIVSEMSGVIITIFLLMTAFSMAFYYLTHTVSRLRTIEEMKDDFISNMTHELKTPIAIAYSANDALLNFDKDNDPSKREKYLTIANRQLKRLRELVENILAMSMERRKTLKLKSEKFLLLPFVEEIVSAYRMTCDKKISISVNIDNTISIEADKTHLANVLNNLIDNSIKYSGDEVSIIITGNDKEISIRDNGIGIPAKAIPYLFNKFYRVPNGNRQDVRGYGIGLYYVKKILDKMGCTISVNSKEAVGSVFTIKFNGYE